MSSRPAWAPQKGCVKALNALFTSGGEWIVSQTALFSHHSVRSILVSLGCELERGRERGRGMERDLEPFL